MNGNQATIDRIVSLVTERLKRLHSPSGDVTVAPPHATNNNANSEHASCWITDQVVSLTSLDKRLENIKCVNLRRGAVITPSAQDELRRRNIQVVYVESELPAALAANRLLLSIWNINYDPQALLVKVNQSNLVVDAELGVDGLHAMSQAVRTNGDGMKTLGALLTDHPCEAACRLNREPHLRAAAIYDFQNVSEAVASLRANVIAINPNRQGLFATRHLIHQFVRESTIS